MSAAEQSRGLGGVGGTGYPTPAELGPFSRWRKRSLPGNMASALYRIRRAPLNALRAKLAARSDGPPPPADSRTRYRAVWVIPAGPRDWEPLQEAIESVLHYEGDDAKVIVVDDGTVECREAVVRARFPQVDVVRRRWPDSGPPRNYPTVSAALRWALGRYEFDVAAKIDTDALVTGPHPSKVAATYFERNPEVGMIGTHLVRGDGEPEFYGWDAWVLPHTVRWSRAARELVKRARAGGYKGPRVNGIYFLSRALVESASRSGDLDWRSPWWTPLGEDFWMSIVTAANGFGFGSFGGPGEPMLIAPNFLPAPAEQALAEGRLIVHSLRRGLHGESEGELRAFFRDVRSRGVAAAAQDAPASDATPPRNAPPGR